ncbi:MAG: class I SAM-dependent methyltransferase [Planctomycetota bacterium]
MTEDGAIHSFLSDDGNNNDREVIDSFGCEWKKFSAFSEEEIMRTGREYFDLIDDKILNRNSVVLDIGCGSGRFTKYISPKVSFVEAIDPSESVFTAKSFLNSESNVRVTQADIDHIPFPDDAFDFIFCLGVLHHVSETQAALKKCVEKLKPGGHFLIYLYYDLDDRGRTFKALLFAVNLCRRFICKLPPILKNLACDFISLVVYLPLAFLCRAMLKIPHINSVAKFFPLYYYHNKTYRIMRNDALDRFGTSVEKRYTKAQIQQILLEAKLKDISFSPNMPFWHAVGRK